MSSVVSSLVTASEAAAKRALPAQENRDRRLFTDGSKSTMVEEKTRIDRYVIDPVTQDSKFFANSGIDADEYVCEMEEHIQTEVAVRQRKEAPAPEPVATTEALPATNYVETVMQPFRIRPYPTVFLPPIFLPPPPPPRPPVLLPSFPVQVRYYRPRPRPRMYSGEVLSSSYNVNGFSDFVSEGAQREVLAGAIRRLPVGEETTASTWQLAGSTTQTIEATPGRAALAPAPQKEPAAETGIVVRSGSFNESALGVMGEVGSLQNLLRHGRQLKDGGAVAFVSEIAPAHRIKPVDPSMKDDNEDYKLVDHWQSYVIVRTYFPRKRRTAESVAEPATVHVPARPAAEAEYDEVDEPGYTLPKVQPVNYGMERCVIIDNGSGTIKAGLAGDTDPRVVMPNIVGRAKYHNVMDASNKGDLYIGETALSNRGVLQLTNPVDRGVVKNWDDMEAVWQYMFGARNLNVNPEEHPVLMTEPPLNPDRNRTRSAEILFESFNVPALHIMVSASAACINANRNTGVVVDVGDGVTHVVPVYYHAPVMHAVQRMDIAGRDITNQMVRLMAQTGTGRFTTTAEHDICREIKERMGFVSINPANEEKANRTLYEPFTMPDGQVIQVGPERFQAVEVLFDPNILGKDVSGIAEMIKKAVDRTPEDQRPFFYRNIVLSGGSTIFPGFEERVRQDVQNLTPHPVSVVKVPRESRHLAVWRGCSKLASEPTFKAMWLTKAKYDEEGDRAVRALF